MPFSRTQRGYLTGASWIANLSADLTAAEVTNKTAERTMAADDLGEVSAETKQVRLCCVVLWCDVCVRVHVCTCAGTQSTPVPSTTTHAPSLPIVPRRRASIVVVVAAAVAVAVDLTGVMLPLSTRVPPPHLPQSLSAVMEHMIQAEQLERHDSPMALLYDLDHLRGNYGRCKVDLHPLPSALPRHHPPGPRPPPQLPGGCDGRLSAERQQQQLDERQAGVFFKAACLCFTPNCRRPFRTASCTASR